MPCEIRKKMEIKVIWKPNEEIILKRRVITAPNVK